MLPNRTRTHSRLLKIWPVDRCCIGRTVARRSEVPTMRRVSGSLWPSSERERCPTYLVGARVPGAGVPWGPPPLRGTGDLP